MTLSTHLALPYIDAAQAQKHVTHNEAMQLLDGLVHLSVAARNQAAPPAQPAEGQRFLVATGATGSFTGKDLQIATYLSGAWVFLVPRAGWRAFVEAESLLLIYDGASWRDAGLMLKTLQNLSLIGLNTTADASNPFSAKLNAALFTGKTVAEGGSGDLRFTLNKESSAKTVSQLYQTNYSGRAETGLTGDDRFHVKVSPDGSTWKESINIDSATGLVSFPSGVGDGSPAGFRNRIVNGNFLINQRAYASGAALAAGVYAHDRWKAGASGATYTFVQNPPDTTITITAGSLQQIIEGSNLEGGTFTLSWTGTAQGRVNGGSYGASPLTVTGLSAGANVTIEFNAGTLSKVQFESGSYPTIFERRPRSVELMLCQRYYYVNTLAGSLGMATASTDVMFGFSFPVSMRATPTLALLKTSVSGAAFDLLVGSVWVTAGALSLSSAGVGLTNGLAKVTGFSGLTLSALSMGNSVSNFLAFSAEL
jgi:hypothetical protein